MSHSRARHGGSLLDMPSGCKLCVEELAGSPSVRSRLYSLGILPGTEVEVCRQACGKGSICLRVRQCSLVLSEGMASAVRCRMVEDSGHHHRRHNHGRWGWFGQGHDHGHACREEASDTGEAAVSCRCPEGEQAVTPPGVSEAVSRTGSGLSG